MLERRFSVASRASHALFLSLHGLSVPLAPAMQAEAAAAAADAAATTAAATQAAAPSATTTTPLFGGALSAAIPARLADVALARPVPDHQEVFADPSSDQALVIEVLEHASDVPDGEGAARFYFEDLVEQNEASEGARLGRVEALRNSSSSSPGSASSSSPVLLLRGLAASPAPPSARSSALSTALDACSYAAVAVGTASISKGGSSTPGSAAEQQRRRNAVSLALALLRFPAVGSDLLVSLTTATALGDGNYSSAVVPADLAGRDPAEIAAEAERLLLAIVGSLEVRDWRLFG